MTCPDLATVGEGQAPDPISENGRRTDVGTLEDPAAKVVSMVEQDRVLHRPVHLKRGEFALTRLGVWAGTILELVARQELEIP